jgi:hypothetical protein
VRAEPEQRAAVKPLRSAGAVVDALARSGLLLRQDSQLPSVVTLLAGEGLCVSWWSHPQARRMFRVMEELSAHPDVVVTKLLCGKDTFVHRCLWRELLGLVRTRRPWQLAGLSAQSRALLARTARSRTDVPASGPAVKPLLQRLLVHATEVHTACGRHALVLVPWSRWARDAGVRGAASYANARGELERRARALGAPVGALPWER